MKQGHQLLWRSPGLTRALHLHSKGAGRPEKTPETSANRVTARLSGPHENRAHAALGLARLSKDGKRSQPNASLRNRAAALEIPLREWVGSQQAKLAARSDSAHAGPSPLPTGGAAMFQLLGSPGLDPVLCRVQCRCGGQQRQKLTAGRGQSAGSSTAPQLAVHRRADRGDRT